MSAEKVKNMGFDGGASNTTTVLFMLAFGLLLVWMKKTVKLRSSSTWRRYRTTSRTKPRTRLQAYYQSCCRLIPPVFGKFMMSSSAESDVELSDSVREVKEKYEKMEIEEKRALYKCGKKFVDLEHIITWEKYHNDNKNKISPFKGDKKYDVKEALNSKVSLWQGDITVLEIDAIVNAANSSLLGGGGVDGAIHRAAGGELLDECRELGGCPAGQAKITGGYKLPAKNVIHTVGPQSEKPGILISCYVNCLQVMLENELRTIAFPCIATGIYGYPRANAANIALTTAREFLETNHEKVDRIIFTVFLEEDKEAYEYYMQKYFPLE